MGFLRQIVEVVDHKAFRRSEEHSPPPNLAGLRGSEMARRRHKALELRLAQSHAKQQSHAAYNIVH